MSRGDISLENDVPWLEHISTDTTESHPVRRYDHGRVQNHPGRIPTSATVTSNFPMEVRNANKSGSL
jgi:hypothetical protein